MTQPWTTCPDCDWNYEQHGDTHKARNCDRAWGRVRHFEHVPVEPYVGIVVSAAEADAWHEQIRVIMAEQHLNFGEAVNWYIEQHKLPLAIGVDMASWDAA